MLALTRRLLPTLPTLPSARAFSVSTPARNSAAAAPPPAEASAAPSAGEALIHAKLTAKFAPSQLQVMDVSGGCGSFYAITIASQAFKGLPIVKQHKLVTETLKAEIAGIHGLQIKTIST